MFRKKKALDAWDLPKEWHGGRLYAVVSKPGTYWVGRWPHTFTGSSGLICLFSLVPEDLEPQ